MERASAYVVDFNIAPCEALEAAGGGLTELRYLAPRGGTDRIVVNLNFSLADTELRANNNLAQLPEQLVAHELGHVSALVDGFASGRESNVRSLDWENAARLDGPRREDHGARACTQGCR